MNIYSLQKFVNRKVCLAEKFRGSGRTYNGRALAHPCGICPAGLKDHGSARIAGSARLSLSFFLQSGKTIYHRFKAPLAEEIWNMVMMASRLRSYDRQGGLKIGWYCRGWFDAFFE
jgi:hypothetical protein